MAGGGSPTLVVGNWKMNLDRGRARALAGTVAAAAVCRGPVQVMVAPAHPHLVLVAECLAGTPVGLAAQDLHWEAGGAFTGAVSAGMLADAGASHVLVGHSERRLLFGDDDRVVALKIQAAVDAGLTPIVCVGETAAQRDAGEALAVVARQWEAARSATGWSGAAAPLLAYEPVWAIGTGRVARPAQAAEVHAHLRALAGAGARILYGGSVTPDNAGDLMAEAEVDGLLVGGASLSPDSFLAVVEAAADRRRA